jgi:hypothetical protein
MRRRTAAVSRPITPDASSLAERVSVLLRRAQPFAYCDDCLARYFSVSRAAAQRAAGEVGAGEGFLRRSRRCRGCQRTADVTWRLRPASSFLMWGRADRTA